MDAFAKNNKGYQILTDSGWSNFSGVILTGKKTTVKVVTEYKEIDCTDDHVFFTEALVRKSAKELSESDKIVSYDESLESVISVSTNSENEDVFDIVNVEKGNRFYANSLLVSNCRFITYEETLINPLKLTELSGIEPTNNVGQVRWYKKPSPIYTYVITLDPSAGTGGDSAGIQVVELPTMVQVAEWQHNKTPVEGQIKVLMDIMQYIRDFGAHQIFWTVENNTIGEAALVVIRDTGEENFPGEFLSEPTKVAGKRGRRGFTTTHKSKIEACVSLKRYIEQGKLTVNSKALISELKNFVAKGNSYAAKPGETDDLVMSLVLAVRVIAYVSTFDDDVYSRINSSIGLSEIMGGVAEEDEPMPIGFL